MPELITLAAIGGAVAKSLVKHYSKDPASETLAVDTIDILKSLLVRDRGNRMDQKSLNAIGDVIVKELASTWNDDPVFNQFDEGTQAAIRRALIHNLAVPDAKLAARGLLQLDAEGLANHLLARPISEHVLQQSEQALYERMLRDASTRIVAASQQHPGFDRAIRLEILGLLTEIRDDRVKRDTDNQAWEAKYREFLVKKLNRFEPFGAPHYTDEYEFQPLDLSYVRLDYDAITQPRTIHTSTKGREARNTSARTQLSPHPRSAPIDEVLKNGKRLVVRGEAGSGKTTFMHWLAIQSATKSFTGDLEFLNKSVPLYVRLRDCVKRDLIIPIASDLPSLLAPDLWKVMPTEWCEDYLQRGAALVLIDGVDEVPATQRNEVLDRLNDLIQQYPLATYILTSRPLAIAHERWERWDTWTQQRGFKVASISRMTPDQVDQLIDRWHKAVASLFARRELELARELRQLADPLRRLLRQRPALRLLAENPLLCAMICAVHREYRDQLASQRLELYEQCTTMLLHGRDVRRKVASDSPAAELSLAQKQRPLSKFALWLLEQGLTEIDPAEAIDKVFNAQASFLRHRNIKGEDLVDYYVDRSGILQSPAVDKMEFSHRSFQDYLAASAIAARNNLDALRPFAAEDRWREPIVLAVGQIEQDNAETFLRWVLDHSRTANKSDMRTYHLLALACLETIPAIDPDLVVRIESAARAYVPPHDEEEARTVARVGEPLVPLLANPKGEYILNMAACVTALATVGSTLALEALKAYATMDNWNVDTALGRAWVAFDPIDFAHSIWNIRKAHDAILPSPIYLEALASIPPRKKLRALAADSLDLFANCAYLEQLILRDTRVENLTPLAGLTNLHSLDLRHTPVKDLTPLAGLTGLRSLDLGETESPNLAPLSELVGLLDLRLERAKNVDLSPLFKLTNLRNLSVRGVNSLEIADAIDQLQESNRNLRIIR